METGHWSTRAVNSGSGNRALLYRFPLHKIILVISLVTLTRKTIITLYTRCFNSPLCIQPNTAIGESAVTC